MNARTKKKSPKLGHDPLAWINESTAPEPQANNGKTGAKQEPPEEYDIPQDSLPQPELEVSNQPVEASSPDESMIVLPERFGIAQVGEIKNLMEEKLSRSDAGLVLDAENVESIDSAGMQLLMCLAMQAEKEGKALRFTAESPKIRSVAELLNVSLVMNLN